MKQIIKLLLLSAFLFIATGCSEKQPEANKPALYWYKKVIESVDRFDLESAGDHYGSLKSEHFMSPLIPEATLIMAMGHIKSEEYLLANFYLDEYIKRYGASDNIEFIKYLKLKANYQSFKYPNRNQKLLLDSIEKAQQYKTDMKRSEFVYYADSILATLKVANANMNQEIGKLYQKKGKEKGYQLYKEKSEIINDNNLNIKDPDVSWLRAFFE